MYITNEAIRLGYIRNNQNVLCVESNQVMDSILIGETKGNGWRSTKQETIEKTFVSLNIWEHLKKFVLTENMRLLDDPQFSNFLSWVGSRFESYIHDDYIIILENMIIFL